MSGEDENDQSIIYSAPDYTLDYNGISKPRWVNPMITVSAIDMLFSDC
jgi:hypothetical protein